MQYIYTYTYLVAIVSYIFLYDSNDLTSTLYIGICPAIYPLYLRTSLLYIGCIERVYTTLLNIIATGMVGMPATTTSYYCMQEERYSLSLAMTAILRTKAKAIYSYMYN